MLQSQLFTKTGNTFPKDEEAINAKYLIRAGYVRKLSAGIYAYLPLGWRVFNKIVSIVREEMDRIGGQELLMPALIAKEYWAKSDRWNVEAMYKLKTSAGEEYGLGWTHEEVIVALVSHFIRSYKDLPFAAYQIQNKFRSEARSKSGLLRAREFSMKDLYSFHADVQDLNKYYQTVSDAYNKIFRRLNVGAKIAEASGGAFTREYTHEFQIPCEAGEDTIFFCSTCDFCQNKEIAKVKAGSKCPRCGGEVQETRAIEAANIFKLGTRYSKPFNLYFLDQKGNRELVIMGCYGLGPSRLMGAIVEIYHDNYGIIWPASIAPYRVHLLQLGGLKKTKAAASKIYDNLQKNNIEVLYDDREISAGEKFVDADLVGIPWRAIVSEKTLAKNKIEMKRRDRKETKMVTFKELVKLCSKF